MIKTDKEVCIFTDHNLIYIETRMNGNNKKIKIKKKVRDLKMIRHHPEKFIRALQSIQWEKLAICNDVDEQVEFYTSEIKKVLNHLAPIKEKVIWEKRITEAFRHSFSTKRLKIHCNGPYFTILFHSGNQSTLG